MLARQLLGQGIEFITSIHDNMKNKLMSMSDKLMLRKRSLIETVNYQLKNISQIEHSRHRPDPNFVINLLAGLAAYCFQPKNINHPTTSSSNLILLSKTQVVR